jgi:amino acid transporter
MTTAESPLVDSERRLHGNLGVMHLFFSVMAWNAPLVIVVGIIPVMLFAGNGVGTPFAFIVAGLIILAFAVGFTRMARVLPNPGAFYSYITAGLGREAGLGAGLLALAMYFCAYAGTFAFGGVVLGSLVHDTFNGPEAPWWAWALLFWAFVGVLGYLRIDLSAKVLMVFLAAEVLAILVFDLLVASQGGASGLSGAPFSPDHWFDGSFGLGLMFAIGMFGGFEITALFRDEVRDPDRTVPRATYAVVGFAMVFYALTAFLLINALGVDNAVAAAAENPAGVVSVTMEQFGNKFLADLVIVFVNTSTLAVILAGHNIVSRYAFNLSADRILPGVLSGVHPRHGSPHRASVTASVGALVVSLPVVLGGVDPIVYYAAILGVLSVGFLLMLLLTDVAVVRYMKANGGAHSSVWATLVCPVIAFIGLLSCLVLALQNFDLIIGGSRGLANLILALTVAIFAGGCALALVLKRSRPDVYAKIGRQ